MLAKETMLKLLREQGVKTRITLGLLTIALLVVAVGGLGIGSQYHIAQLSNSIAEYSAPALLSAEQMKSNTLRLQQGVLSYTLLRSDTPLSNKTIQDMSDIIADYNGAKQDFLEALENHQQIRERAGYPDMSDHIQLEAAFKRYWSLATALVNEVRPKDIPTFKTRLNKAEDDLLYHIDAIILHETKQIVATQETLTQLSSKLIYLNIGVILIALMLALLIAYHTSRTIIEPLLDLEAAAIHLGQGNFLSEATPLPASRSMGEIGILARAFTDMSDNLRRLNNDLKHNANHDNLTGLANRKYLLETLEAHLDFAAPKEKSALLFLDFDRFKAVNDYYGHQVGDGLLIAISKRLQETVRSHDLLARLGGDEFTVLLTEFSSNAQAEKMATRLLQAFRHPFKVADVELRMTASIGIVHIDDSLSSAEDILRDADIAMYRAKAKGTGRYEVFTEALRQETFALTELEADLRKAIAQRQLEVHYQPIIALEDAQAVGTEALVRWEHPERGMVHPDQFIPLAEETGLIVELDRFVLREACAQTVRWNEQFGTRLSISVNLSGQQFTSQNLTQEIRNVLTETGLCPELLQLEITETILMHQTDLTLDILKSLKALGVTLHMDDFGTGYSSLAYLQHFDLDTLKIDRSFIDQMLESFEGDSLVRTILAMAETLDLNVIAEGVETEKQATHLQGLNCTLAQGYLFSKPKPAAALEVYFLETLHPIDHSFLAAEGLEANL